MAVLADHFRQFIKEIRPTDSQKDLLKRGHITLRERIDSDPELKSIIHCTFLQGSYKRATIIRPQNEERSDVDVVVVTNLDRKKCPRPNRAMELFEGFLNRHYEGKYKRQGRSFGIKLSYVDLDLVISSAPILADVEKYKKINDLDIEEFGNFQDWKTKQLWIPDREAGEWKPTNPIAQMGWTTVKNRETSGHYGNVVKAIKWWHRVFCFHRPKGYPLEHLVGQYCPDKIGSVAEGVVKTFAGIVRAGSSKPYFPAHEVSPLENVFERILPQEYAQFYEDAKRAARLAEEAFGEDDPRKSALKWRELFGKKFPGEIDKGPFVSSPSPKGDQQPRRYGSHE